MEIRAFEMEDIPELVELWKEFMDFHTRLEPDFVRSDGAAARWAEYVRSKFNDDLAQIFVAVDEGRVVAYVGAVIREYPPVFTISQYGFIEEIAVTSDCRRKGIGGRLLLAAEQWLLDAGAGHIKVNIDVVNEASQAFFRRAGFVDHTESLVKRYPAAKSME